MDVFVVVSATKWPDELSTLRHAVMDRVTCGQLASIIGRITTQSAFADGWRARLRSQSLAPVAL